APARRGREAGEQLLPMTYRTLGYRGGRDNAANVGDDRHRDPLLLHRRDIGQRGEAPPPVIAAIARALPAAICSLASCGCGITISTLPATRFAIRSASAGVETKVHLVPVALCSSSPVMLSIAVSEPPACFSAPGFRLASSMNSLSVL